MKKLSLTKFEFICEFNSPQRLFSLFLIYNCLLNDRRMKKKVVAIKRGKNKLKIRFRYKLIMKIPHLRDWENFKLLHLLLLLLLGESRIRGKEKSVNMQNDNASSKKLREIEIIIFTRTIQNKTLHLRNRDN